MFDGAIALVTGGASGIGLALATGLAGAGATVVVADVDGPGAAAAADGIGPRASGATLDVRDRVAVRALVDEVVGRHGRLDLLVNNAGISLGGETHLMSAEHWDRIVDVNLGGVVNGVLAAYPGMVARGRGHIVNTASMAGLSGPPMTAAYSTTKHAVVGLSLTLRPEAALHGVAVTVLCPGAVETPILDKAPPDDLPPQPASTLTARQFLELARQRPITAQAFAGTALRGIARNRAVVIAPRSARALWWLQRSSPGAMQLVGRALAGRVLRALPG